METKICNKCGQEKALECFSFRKDTNSYRHTCKECINKRKRILYGKNHEEEKKMRQIKKLELPNTIICNKCGIEKDAIMFDFRKDTGRYRNVCKECRKKMTKEYYSIHKEEIRKNQKEYGKKYREKNKEILSEKGKKYYILNKETIKIRHKKNNARRYLEKKEQILQYSKEYKETHKDQIRFKMNNYERKRKSNDPLFKLTKQVRTLLNASFSSKGYKKNTKTEKILGIDINSFIIYLLSTYKLMYGEDWDGKEEIHIDHIIPLSTAKTEEDIIRLCYYTNLQLLKAKDNLEKSDKLDWVKKD